jgi:hypothetical protein
VSSSVFQRFDSIDGLQDGAVGAPGLEGPPGLEVGVWGIGFRVEGPEVAVGSLIPPETIDTFMASHPS